MSMAAVSFRLRAALFFAAVIVVVVLSAVGPAGADFASDRAECGDQLVGLATCIMYVEGRAKAPTPDCCAGLKQVVAKSLKCVCVLIKDRNDPGLGFKVNVTLALQLPSACSAPANISDCPKLLNLPPNSEDAKIFEQFEKDIEARAAGNSTQGGTSSTSGNAGADSSKNKPSSGAENVMRRIGVRMASLVVVWMLSILLYQFD